MTQPNSGLEQIIEYFQRPGHAAIDSAGAVPAGDFGGLATAASTF